VCAIGFVSSLFFFPFCREVPGSFLFGLPPASGIPRLPLTFECSAAGQGPDDVRASVQRTILPKSPPRGQSAACSWRTAGCLRESDCLPQPAVKRPGYARRYGTRSDNAAGPKDTRRNRKLAHVFAIRRAHDAIQLAVIEPIEGAIFTIVDNHVATTAIKMCVHHAPALRALDAAI